ncbi:adhesion G protein-coupled receptor L4-like [Stylophora pistillata]|uniref:adhesion G protein-coupled receptor L4-like n=1 Tax=Stylophora pistillata TaxID=50429 RepID=UPI000C047529|nr:adhesion G protein-coupled receptor L4-like [Stylophora pistillata]
MFTALSIRCFLIVVIVSFKGAESQRNRNCTEGSCYVFKKEENTWKDARTSCQQQKGDLVSIETEEEWDFIKGVIKNYTNQNSTTRWQVGLEKKAGKWIWVTGRPLTICKWGKNQSNGNGDVASITCIGKSQTILSDVPRNTSGPFICEITKGTGHNNSQGICKHVGIPCELEYGKRSWAQNCKFAAYDCKLNCTYEPPSGKFNEECDETFNPYVQQCSYKSHAGSTYHQICNVTKCNLTEGEQKCTTNNTCYCEGDQCNHTRGHEMCTQTCIGLKSGEASSYSLSPSPSLSQTPLLCKTPSMSPSPLQSPSLLMSLSPSSQISSTSSSSSASLAKSVLKLANIYLSELHRIDITKNTSLQTAMRIFEHFIISIENISNLSDGQSDMEKVGQRRESIFKVAVVLEEIAINYSKHHLLRTNHSKRIHSQKMVLSIYRASRRRASGFHSWKEEGQASINVSSANFADYGQVVIGCVYKDLHQLLQLKRPIKKNIGITRDVGSKIIFVAMYPKPKKLRENVTLKFRDLKGVEGRKVCAFWSGFRERSASDGFSEEGCHPITSERDSEETICSCNHLTHFAVLVDYNSDLKLTEEDETILEIITYVGLSLSIVGILLTIILYSFLTDVREPLSQIRLSLSVSLGAGQMIFLAGINATENTAACVTAAVFMQYFLMAAFFWMLVEGVYLYLLVVKVFNITEKMHMYHVMSWGSPIIVIGISLFITAGKGGLQSYTSDKYCWLSSTNNLIWIFISFVLFIEVLNILILVRVIREMTTLVQPLGEYNHIQQIRLSIKTCAVMVPLLGFTWLFGLFLPMHKTFAYILTIFNSIQGFLIFAFHCVRNSQIRERFKRKTNTIFPSTADNGNSIKKSTKINPSGASDMRAIELQSFND